MLAYFTRRQQQTLSISMLMLTLLATLTLEDLPPVKLFYSITVVSPGSRRNKPLSPNQLPKQNSLLCSTVLTISDGFLNGLADLRLLVSIAMQTDNTSAHCLAASAKMIYLRPEGPVHLTHRMLKMSTTMLDVARA